MAPVIYTSAIPPVAIVNRSIFTHLFAASSADSTSVGGFPGSYPAFVDAPTGTIITRAQLKHLALSFAFGIRNYPTTNAKVGETILIYSPNNFHWPVVLFGSSTWLICVRELLYAHTISRRRVALHIGE